MPKVKRKRSSTSQGKVSAQNTEQKGSKKPTKRSRKESAESAEDSNMARDMVRAVIKELVKLEDRVKAEQMNKYLKNKFDCYGVQSTPRRDVTKRVLSQFPTLTRDGVVELVKLSWAEPMRELQHFGWEVADKYKKTLAGTDDATCRDAMELAKFMVTNKSWWDTVDMIATKIVGDFARQQPSTVNPILDEWIEDENMWLRRTAILHQLSYKSKTDSDRLFRYCLKCAHEEEFFIQKAIGWSLRQYHYVNKSAVRKFVKENEDKLAKLSKSEALKHD